MTGHGTINLDSVVRELHEAFLKARNALVRVFVELHLGPRSSGGVRMSCGHSDAGEGQTAGQAATSVVVHMLRWPASESLSLSLAASPGDRCTERLS